jgi:hypothetical protein
VLCFQAVAVAKSVNFDGFYQLYKCITKAVAAEKFSFLMFPKKVHLAASVSYDDLSGLVTFQEAA